MNHLVAPTSFIREDRHANRIVEQDQRDNQQRTAEQQQDHIELIDILPYLFEHTALVNHLGNALPLRHLLFERRDRLLVRRTGIQPQFIRIGQRILLEELDEIVAEVLFELLGSGILADKMYFAHGLIRRKFFRQRL